MSRRVALFAAQTKLATMWLLAAAAIFLFLLAQTVVDKYGDKWPDAWAWFLPTVVPTLSLIVGGVVFASRDPNTNSKTVDRSLFRIAYALSAFYLVAVVATLLLQPLSRMTPLEMMSASKVWLGALQGILGLALGAFFTSKE
jgi:hypothetical protein